MEGLATRAARVSVRMLYNLLEQKEKEVSERRDALNRAEQELTALKALYQQTAAPASDFSYPAFIQSVQNKDKRLAEILDKSKCVQFDLGLLKIKAPKVEAQMLHLFRGRIEELAEEYLGVPIKLQVKDE
jgi:DNA repair exonuclease SbcCD ATPase subunit